VLREIKDKNVTVIGLARSGIGAANLLAELGGRVTVTDTKTEEELKESIPKLDPSVRLALGSHPEDIFLHADTLIVSPGVPLDIRPLFLAKSKGIPILGELELAYQVIRSQKSEAGSQIGFLAVTGTNGKSTTTALLDFMMKKGGFRTILGGNIGNAVTEEISKMITSHESRVTSHDYIVVEVSSFQLESITDFRPKVAAIVNITPDHLDRYRSIEEYGAAKARIFENQTANDFLVLNLDDPETMKVKSEKLRIKSEKPKLFYFSRKQEVEGIYSKNGIVYCNIQGLPLTPCSSPLIKVEEIKIKGVHNLENAMAASAMALLAGCPVEAVIDSLKEFAGLEHRLEFVRELDGVSYYNDSKGTNVDAVLKSLESFSSPVILIAGGRDKEGDFSRLRDLVQARVKALILIGEASEKIKKAVGDVTDVALAKDLGDAVNSSRNRAIQGDTVLLSPACASFDMFTNFEHRGRQFKKIVMEMN
jgi:UDP-N-acetylmuramoylalanine--D-glutamate ligase